jgi:hypothetical protein
VLASNGLEALQPTLIAASALVSDFLSEHQVQRIPLYSGIYISLEPNIGPFLPSFSL